MPDIKETTCFEFTVQFCHLPLGGRRGGGGKQKFFCVSRTFSPPHTFISVYTFLTPSLAWYWCKETGKKITYIIPYLHL